MNSWFRVYNSMVDDPKVRKLPDNLVASLLWLWCIAGENDGVLPPVDDVAFKLRCAPTKAAELITKLCRAGLIDHDNGIFRPHNWGVRQYKTDVTDPTGAKRSKSYRDRKRDASRCDETSVTDVTIVRNERPEQSQNRTEQIDIADDARAPLVGKPAMDLAEMLLIIAGHDPKFWPPGWCGAPMRVQTWLNENWPAEIIISATTAAAARKHGAPASSVQFFEKAIAEEVARQAAPVPIINIREAQTHTVNNHARPQAGNIIQASDRLVDTIRSFDDGAAQPDRLRSGEGAPDVRLLSKG